MKKSFTMLELVFVIVVVGILSTIIIPSTRTNPLQEAAIQILSDIRYTQHLAMVDDRYNTSNLDSTGSPRWFKERWQIIFSSNTNSGGQMGYTIFSDTAGDSTGNPQESEIAINPVNVSKRLTGGFTGAIALNIDGVSFIGTNKLNVGRSYGIDNISFSNSCDGANGSSKRIAFDHMGRPLQGDISTNIKALESDDLIQSDCDILLTHSSGDTITIRVQEETGYSCILSSVGVCI